MNNSVKKIAWSGLAALALSAPLSADHHMSADSAQMVELYTCNYVGNADRGDLDRVVARYNKWADKHDNSYTAWLLTPNFANPDIDWEIGWMGAWPNGNAMGAGLDTWREKGLQADFDKVIKCNNHMAAASVNIKPPKNEKSPARAVATFRTCKVAEGVSIDDAFTANQEMANFMGGKGSTGGAWIFFPSLGAGKLEFDYYFVLGYENYAALGHDQEVVNNGGGWQKRQELLGEKIHCDVQRVYDADLVRQPG